MEKAFDYLSQDWRIEAEERLQKDLPPEMMNHITSSMSNVYQSCPDGTQKYLIFNYEEGRLTDLVLGKGDPPKAEFKVIGTYDTFASLSRAELGALKALMTGK